MISVFIEIEIDGFSFVLKRFHVNVRVRNNFRKALYNR